MNKVAVLIILLLAGVQQAMAQQTMPTIFNQAFGKPGSLFNKVIPLENGGVIAVGKSTEGGLIVKLDSIGAETKTFKDNLEGKYKDVNFRSVMLDGDNIVVIGGGTIAHGKAVITKLSAQGKEIQTMAFGDGNGGYFTEILRDEDGNYVMSGVSGDGNRGSVGRLTKVPPDLKKPLYDQPFGTNILFTQLVVDQDNAIIAVGGQMEGSQGSGHITKIDQAGNVVYDLSDLKDEKHPSRPTLSGQIGLVYTEVILLNNGEIIAAGGGTYGSGSKPRLTKISDDGQIVFDKTYSTLDGFFSKMILKENGHILACADELDNGRIVEIKNNGTVVFNRKVDMPLSDLQLDHKNQVIAIGGASDYSAGIALKIDAEGKHIAQQKIPGIALDKLVVSADGEAYATSKIGYTITKLNLDEQANTKLNLDKQANQVVFNMPAKSFDSPIAASIAHFIMSKSGEIMAVGGGTMDGGRLIKLSHGLSINDIKVSEPLDGIATATLTVTLSGFLRKNGVKQNVSVEYQTLSARTANTEDYVPSKGSLLFSPERYATGAPITQSIEIPIKADNLLEGIESVFVQLTDVKDSYITKSQAEITILDQPAYVKFTGGTDGQEGFAPIIYTAGLFKSNGDSLINATSQPIKLSYRFGNGSAKPGADYNHSTKTPFLIKAKAHTGKLAVQSYADNFYQAKQSVELVLTEIKAPNDADVRFKGSALSAAKTQNILDAGAQVKLVKISDRDKTNTAKSGMFKVVLVRPAENGNQKPAMRRGSMLSSDGLLVNKTGSDIVVHYDIDAASTAKSGEDFVLSTGKTVKIGADQSEASILVSLVNDLEKGENKSIVLKLQQVTAPPEAGNLALSTQLATAMIINNNE